MLQPSQVWTTHLLERSSCVLGYYLRAGCGGEKKKVCTAYKPHDKRQQNRRGGGGSAEMTRWLEEGRKKRKMCGPTFLFSQLIFVICHPESVWPHSCVCVCVWVSRAVWGLCLTPFIINDMVLGGSCIDVRALSSVRGSSCWKSPRITGSK